MNEFDGLEIRKATEADLGAILDLARHTLGWEGDDDDASLFAWKHFHNAHGESSTWIALDDEEIVGLRTFLRWRLERPDGSQFAAARAVDTATAPDYQRRGLFTRLTRAALDELEDEAVSLVFNTPNERSLAGNLKLGWRTVGRLPVSVLPTRIGSFAVLATARQSAQRASLPAGLGESPRAVFGDTAAVERLLAALPRPSGLATPRTPRFLAWRYGLDLLRYRVLLAGPSPENGLLVYRLRRRGAAVEAVVNDVLVPGGDEQVARGLVRRLASAGEADYLLRISRRAATLDPFVRVPGAGPVLVCRTLDGSAPPRLRDWALTMGDVELF